VTLGVADREVVFLVVTLLVWIVSAIFQSRKKASDEGQRRRGPRGRGEDAVAPDAEPVFDFVEVTPGEGELRWRPPPPAPAPDEEFRAPEPLGVGATLDLPALPSERGVAPAHDFLGARVLPTEVGALEVKTRAAERRAAAWARLGLGGRVAGREALRRGVLWSEVLGAPRALAGPHRSPAARRAAARRG
jgi:hypothetical protein